LLDTRYGSLFYIPSSNLYLLLNESYELGKILPKFVNNDTVFVDIGAHIGLYTLWACKRARRVVSIEPNPEALVYLKTNIALNKCSNVTVVPKVVGDRRGFTKLKIPKIAGKRFIPTSSSIVRDFDKTLKVNEVDVEMDTLDNILDEIGVDEVDFIKVDVEEAEGLVVKGAQKTLEKAKTILIEIRPKNIWVARYLQNIGYKLVEAVEYRDYRNYLFVKQVLEARREL